MSEIRGEPGITLDDRTDARAQRRIRVSLISAVVVFVVVIALPILTSFTHILDGVVGGIGVAYIVGFGEFVFAMAGAVAYCRWCDRLEDEGTTDGEAGR